MNPWWIGVSVGGVLAVVGLIFAAARVAAEGGAEVTIFGVTFKTGSTAALVLFAGVVLLVFSLSRLAETPPPQPNGQTSGTTDCGGSIMAGPNTTCSFAKNVVDKYRASGGDSNLEVYSPVTKQTYTMTCTSGMPTTCRGGNNASVSFR